MSKQRSSQDTGHEEANGVNNGIEMANKVAENGIVQYEGVTVGDERSGKIRTKEMEMLREKWKCLSQTGDRASVSSSVSSKVTLFTISSMASSLASHSKIAPVMGWTVAAATVAHEVPQKLADFYILVT